MQILGFPTGPYETNCYVVVADDGKVTIIDPGMHASSKIVTFLNEHGFTLEKIILTHGHIDHTRDAGILAARYSVPVYINEDDAFMLVDGTGVSERTMLLFDAQGMTPIKDLHYLVDGEKISIGDEDFEIKHAPGHSPGCTLLVGEDIVFSGDVLFKGSIGRTDLGESSPADMQRSLKEVVLPLPDKLQVLPGHGPETTMRAERMSNPFLVNLV